MGSQPSTMASLQDSNNNMPPKTDSNSGTPSRADSNARTPRYIYAVLSSETPSVTSPVPYRMLACFKTWACFPMPVLISAIKGPPPTPDPGAPPTPAPTDTDTDSSPPYQPPNSKIEVLNFSSFCQARVQENLSFVLETWPAGAYRCLMLGWSRELKDACAFLEMKVKMSRGIAGRPYEDPEAHGVGWAFDPSNEDKYAIGAMMKQNGQIIRWDIVKVEVKDDRYE